MNDTQVEQAAERYRDGESLAKLGKHFDVDPQTLSRELKKFDVKIRSPGRSGSARRNTRFSIGRPN